MRSDFQGFGAAQDGHEFVRMTLFAGLLAPSSIRHLRTPCRLRGFRGLWRSHGLYLSLHSPGHAFARWQCACRGPAAHCGTPVGLSGPQQTADWWLEVVGS